MPSINYRGRFAPSPTGNLHIGSLVTAMASFLEARVRNGKWLLRIDDIDPSRVKKGYVENQIKKLEELGFEWDEGIDYQSTNNEYYKNAINQLKEENKIYFCQCSRKIIKMKSKKIKNNYVYPGLCKNLNLKYSKNRSIRVKTNDDEIIFKDEIYGSFCQNLNKNIGDFLLKRSDGVYSYQLAVVVDDNKSRITNVVRGSDLLESTARQIYLQKLLNFKQPKYLHIPIVKDGQGMKISKSSKNETLKKSSPINTLRLAWHYLNQPEPNFFHEASLDEFWIWAIENWDLNLVRNKLTNAR